jgi:acyl-homoserine-lactone acylase
MTYSQSQDPDSPHFSDQSALYGEQHLRDVLFTEEEIAADPNLRIDTISYRD